MELVADELADFLNRDITMMGLSYSLLKMMILVMLANLGSAFCFFARSSSTSAQRCCSRLFGIRWSSSGLACCLWWRLDLDWVLPVAGATKPGSLCTPGGSWTEPVDLDGFFSFSRVGLSALHRQRDRAVWPFLAAAVACA